jgi:hypothetical protein
MSLDATLLRRDSSATVTAVMAAAADVIAITGAPRYLRWRSKRAALARRLGMVVATTDRPGGMFLVTTLRVTVLDSSFRLSSSSAGTSPAVVSATIDLEGQRWRVVVAATGGAPEVPSDGTPTVVIGGVGGPGSIGAERSVTVASCESLPIGGAAGPSPTLAVLRR